VATNADAGTGSLRQAILDLCPGGTIAFDMTQVTSPITLTSGELLIDKDLTIQGPGANILTVMRSAAEVNGTLTIRATLISGNAAGRHGGGIETQGNTSIADSTVVNNSAQQEGGGIGTSAATDINVNVESSTISGNTAANGGGFYLKATLNKYNFKSTILSGNTANVSGHYAENFGTFTSQGYNVVVSVQNMPGAAFTTQPTDQLGAASGLALDGSNRQAFLLSFVGSNEFRTLYPDQTSADAFVNSLDANAGGVLSPNEKTALVNELSPNPSDAALRADVLMKVAPEVRPTVDAD
jgi:hypothetical protein